MPLSLSDDTDEVGEYTRENGQFQADEDDVTNELQISSDLCTDCVSLLKEFNSETARYRNLVIALGGSSDSEFLRDELKKTRRKASELAQKSKEELMPHMQAKQEGSGYDRLWHTFSACLEVLEKHMRKSLELERSFPMVNGSTISLVINTGLSAPLVLDNIPVSVENLDSPLVTKKNIELKELKSLEKEIHDLREMRGEMQRKVDVKPWMIDPVSDSKFECTKSQSTLSEETSTSNDSVVDLSAPQRNRCLCQMTIAVMSFTLFVAIIMVCVILIVND
ncbi:regulator of G-protein signaling 9-binding protein-like [Anneissia japonica]|uniref:regulator of G-protein signaling 9-binding protein-like n=1 Tax=Anneissia japonica TaxID=1529436 RepID=UPI001425A7C1|nr:regulator of G-protein signaling 9-binding protein-like [Anneissia japonica]